MFFKSVILVCYEITGYVYLYCEQIDDGYMGIAEGDTCKLRTNTHTKKRMRRLMSVFHYRSRRER